MSETAGLSSTKLVKCELFNRKMEKTLRFIELDKFKLWLYMMQNKHGFVIGDKSLHLWVSADQYRKHENLYGASHKLEEVDLIDMIIFDEDNKFTYSIARFAPSSERQKMKKILLSHVNRRLLTKDHFEINVYPGYALARFDKIEKFLCGLSGPCDG
jgi:hypothetical protein